MTTAKEFCACDRLRGRAEDAGFVVTPGLDLLYVAKAPGRWPELTSDHVRQFASAEEALAWLDGVMWAQFVERSKER